MKDRRRPEEHLQASTKVMEATKVMEETKAMEEVKVMEENNVSSFWEKIGIAVCGRTMNMSPSKIFSCHELLILSLAIPHISLFWFMTENRHLDAFIMTEEFFILEFCLGLLMCLFYVLERPSPKTKIGFLKYAFLSAHMITIFVGLVKSVNGLEVPRLISVFPFFNMYHGALLCSMHSGIVSARLSRGVDVTI